MRELLPAVILYEYPFNERIRTYLRLEHLFHFQGTVTFALTFNRMDRP